MQNIFTLRDNRTTVVRLLAIVLLTSGVASAHRDDYINETFVYRTVGRHTAEVEYWLDRIDNLQELDDGIAIPRHRDFLRHSFALEYGITDHFMIDGLAATDNQMGSYGFGRLRLESRYRFGEERTHGISPAVSLEYEDDRRENRRTLTPRLVLNRDFKEFNTTLNVLREIELQGPQGNGWGYTAGVRYGEEKHRLRFGAEVQHTFKRHVEGAVIPQMWIKLTDKATVKVGYGQRITYAGQSFFRAVLEWEFGGKE